MGAIDNAKEIARLVRDIGSIELNQKIVDLQAEIIELIQKNNKVEKELFNLKKFIELDNSIYYKSPYYYKEGEEDYPLCPICWEKNKLAIHLTGSLVTTMKGGVRNCKSCNTGFSNIVG